MNGLPTIEFTFNYAWIGYARIDSWLETAWTQYANGFRVQPFLTPLRDKARSHDYETS